MATSKIINVKEHSAQKLKSSDYSSVKIDDVIRSSKPLNVQRKTSIKYSPNNSITITDNKVHSKPKTFLPFRIKFTNIGIESYGPGNPAPIGIAVIGINNYIL